MTERRDPDRRYPSVPERITWTTGFRCATDKDVVGHLSAFADFKTGKGWRGVSVSKLAARCHLPRRTVQRALHRLETDHWILAHRRHRHATKWDICVDRLAPSFGVLTNLSATGGAQAADLSATSGVQTADLSATRGAQDPDLSATGGAPFPCTYRSPVQNVPIPAHGADAPPPQQLPFGPLELRTQEPPDPRTSTAAADVWADVLRHIEPQIPRHQFFQWWDPSVLVEDQGSVLLVRAHTQREHHDLAVHWIQKHFAGLLAEALAAVRPGARVEWRFAVRQPRQERKFG